MPRLVGTRAACTKISGAKRQEQKCFVSAAEHLSRAAVTYHFAKYLFVQDMTQLRMAHAKAVECLDAALPHLDPPGKRVLIPYRRQTSCRRHCGFRGAARTARPPLVLMTMGLDSTKEELLTFELNFLDRGMAILAFDGPGQGEAEYDFPIRHDYENVVAPVIDWVRANIAEVDGDRIGIWGISLGGYYAPRAAAFERRIRAAVANCGPYNWGALWEKLPELTRAAYVHRSHSASETEAREKAFSLSLEGVAGRDRVSALRHRRRSRPPLPAGRCGAARARGQAGRSSCLSSRTAITSRITASTNTAASPPTGWPVS